MKFFTRHDPRFHDQRLYKGGGGGGPYYGNLNELYGSQFAAAEDLRRESKKTFADMDQLRAESSGYGSLANRDRAASQAAADFSDASAHQLQDMTATMASYGISPEDERFQRQLRVGTLGNTAALAAAKTGARDQRETQGFARQQDIASMGLGLPGQATSALNSAGNIASNAGQLQLQSQAQHSANIAGAVRGGIDLYGLMAADGGLASHENTRPLRLNGGGYVQRLRQGGVVGALKNIQPPQPPTAPAQPKANTSPGMTAMAAAGKGGLPQKIGSGVQQIGLSTGSPEITAFGNGMAVPKGADPSVAQFFQSPDTVMQQMASQQVNAAASSVPGLEAGAAGADAAAAAGADAAATTAATAAAETGSTALGAEAGAGLLSSGMLGAAGTALSAALPFVGPALAIAGALGLFRDGGQVDGPGGPKDDLIPAMLSDGEFVMPVGAVKRFGLDKLEKMRQAGLEYEKQLGIH